MAGFENDIGFSKNYDFSSADNQAPREINGLITDGDMWIGSTATNVGGTHINVGTLTSPDSSVTIGYSSPNITLQAGASVPTTFNADTGSAAPIANVLEIIGDTIVAGSTPVITTGATNVITVQVQRSQALAATDASKIGLCNFDSAAFDVDANGFVQLNGGGVAASSFDVQANTAPGTDPVVPSSSGVVTVNGAAVANHSVVLETRSRAANAYNVEVQYATSAASTDATKSGVAHFNSSQFSVDANGFVALAGGGLAIDSITPNSGTSPVVPDSNGNVSILGTGSVTVVGSLNTATVQLTGLTNHAIQIGAGTATLTQLGSGTTGQVLQTNTGADPTWSTATYPSTTTINRILYSSANNTVSEITAANSAVLVSTSTGVPQMSSTMTNGQVIIGSTGATPTAATITAGAGISITNAAGSITVAAAGGGLTWSVITADQSATVNNGYICNKAGLLTLTLPASAAIGDIIRVTGINTALGWKIAQNANQRIHFGTSSTTTGVGGSLESTNIRDSVEIVCVVSGSSTQYNVLSSIGNITVV